MRPICVKRTSYISRSIYVRRPSYGRTRSKQQRKGRDPGRLCWSRKKHGKRTTRRTAIRGQ